MARELKTYVTEEKRRELAKCVISNDGLDESKTGKKITNVALAGAEVLLIVEFAQRVD